MDSLKPRRRSIRIKNRLDNLGYCKEKTLNIQLNHSQAGASKNQTKSQRCFGTNLMNGRLEKYTDQLNEISKPDQQQQIDPISIRSPLIQLPMIIQQVVNQKSEISIYQNDIYNHLLMSEKLTERIPDYMIFQPEIDQHMRSILIQWLIELQEKFCLKDETLFKAVSIMDRVLSLRSIEKDKFQLLGIVCLYLASKYQQVALQDLKRYVKACEGFYSTNDLLDLESKILILLDFNLVTVSPLQIVGIHNQMLQLHQNVLNLSYQILKFCLSYYDMCLFYPSVLGISAIIISSGYLGLQHMFPQSMNEHLKEQEDMFKNCVINMKSIFQKMNKNKILSIQKTTLF